MDVLCRDERSESKIDRILLAMEEADGVRRGLVSAEDVPTQTNSPQNIFFNVRSDGKNDRARTGEPKLDG